MSSDGFFILAYKQKKGSNSEHNLTLIEGGEMKEIMSMLAEIKAKDEEVFDALYGRIVRKFKEVTKEERSNKRE